MFNSVFIKKVIILQNHLRFPHPMRLLDYGCNFQKVSIINNFETKTRRQFKLLTGKKKKDKFTKEYGGLHLLSYT